MSGGTLPSLVNILTKEGPSLQERAAYVLENLAITELFAAVSEMHRSLRILLSFFLFWVIEVKCRSRDKGEELLKTKRCFCS